MAMLTIQSCSDSNSSGRSATRLTVIAPNSIDEIEFLDFGSTKGSKMIGINTDGDWDVTVSDESWVTVNAHAGYGYKDASRYSWLNVTVAANPGEPRTATLTITSGGMSKTIAINQVGTNTEDTFEQAAEFLENVGVGYNLGNTLESNHDITNPEVQSWFNPTTPIDWETCWGTNRSKKDFEFSYIFYFCFTFRTNSLLVCKYTFISFRICFIYFNEEIFV